MVRDGKYVHCYDDKWIDTSTENLDIVFRREGEYYEFKQIRWPENVVIKENS